MNRIFGFLFIAVFLLTSFAGAADLNAPGEKKVTVGSEIKRGYSAVNLSLNKIDFFHDYEVLDYIFKLNRQNNTDSQGFILGASLAAWTTLFIQMNILKTKVSPQDYAFGRDMAVGYFKKFRSLQKELQISDDQLFEAALGPKVPGAKGGPETKGPGSIDYKIREWDFLLKKGELP